MTNDTTRATWISCVIEAAEKHGWTMPQLQHQGMGSILCKNLAETRFVTVKRRLVPPDEARLEGVEWALWMGEQDIIASRRESLSLTPERASFIAAAMQHWLDGHWSIVDAKMQMQEVCVSTEVNPNR